MMATGASAPVSASGGFNSTWPVLDDRISALRSTPGARALLEADDVDGLRERAFVQWTATSSEYQRYQAQEARRAKNVSAKGAVNGKCGVKPPSSVNKSVAQAAAERVVDSSGAVPATVHSAAPGDKGPSETSLMNNVVNGLSLRDSPAVPASVDRNTSTANEGGKKPRRLGKLLCGGNDFMAKKHEADCETYIAMARQLLGGSLASSPELSPIELPSLLSADPIADRLLDGSGAVDTATSTQQPSLAEAAIPPSSRNTNGASVAENPLFDADLPYTVDINPLFDPAGNPQTGVANLGCEVPISPLGDMSLLRSSRMVSPPVSVPMVDIHTAGTPLSPLPDMSLPAQAGLRTPASDQPLPADGKVPAVSTAQDDTQATAAAGDAAAGSAGAVARSTKGSVLRLKKSNRSDTKSTDSRSKTSDKVEQGVSKASHKIGKQGSTASKSQHKAAAAAAGLTNGLTIKLTGLNNRLTKVSATTNNKVRNSDQSSRGQQSAVVQQAAKADEEAGVIEDEAMAMDTTADGDAHVDGLAAQQQPGNKPVVGMDTQSAQDEHAARLQHSSGAVLQNAAQRSAQADTQTSSPAHAFVQIANAKPSADASKNRHSALATPAQKAPTNAGQTDAKSVADDSLRETGLQKPAFDAKSGATQPNPTAVSKLLQLATHGTPLSASDGTMAAAPVAAVTPAAGGTAAAPAAAMAGRPTSRFGAGKALRRAAETALEKEGPAKKPRLMVDSEMQTDRAASDETKPLQVTLPKPLIEDRAAQTDAPVDAMAVDEPRAAAAAAVAVEAVVKADVKQAADVCTEGCNTDITCPPTKPWHPTMPQNSKEAGTQLAEMATARVSAGSAAAKSAREVPHCDVQSMLAWAEGVKPPSNPAERDKFMRMLAHYRDEAMKKMRKADEAIRSSHCTAAQALHALEDFIQWSLYMVEYASLKRVNASLETTVQAGDTWGQAGYFLSKFLQKAAKQLKKLTPRAAAMLVLAQRLVATCQRWHSYLAQDKIRRQFEAMSRTEDLKKPSPDSTQSSMDTTRPSQHGSRAAHTPRGGLVGASPSTHTPTAGERTPHEYVNMFVIELTTQAATCARNSCKTMMEFRGIANDHNCDTALVTKTQSLLGALEMEGGMLSEYAAARLAGTAFKMAKELPK